jgi:hypothetical protein
MAVYPSGEHVSGIGYMLRNRVDLEKFLAALFIGIAAQSWGRSPGVSVSR